MNTLKPLGVDLAVNMTKILLNWKSEVTMVKNAGLYQNSARHLK
jgi:hypothetical protein